VIEVCQGGRCPALRSVDKRLCKEEVKKKKKGKEIGYKMLNRPDRKYFALLHWPL